MNRGSQRRDVNVIPVFVNLGLGSGARGSSLVYEVFSVRQVIGNGRPGQGVKDMGSTRCLYILPGISDTVLVA